MTQTIHPIHTPCKNCVFAQYEEKTQTGCHLNYLDIYRQHNIEILEAYDEYKEFYVVNDKKCIGYREPKWFAQFGDEADTLQKQIEMYHAKNQLNYLTVINLQKLNKESLDIILQQLSKADISSQKIILIRYRDEGLSFAYNTIEDLIKKHNISCSWRIQTMLDHDMEYDEVLHHIVMDSKKYRFILSIDGPDTDPAPLINQANETVHKQLGQFLILSNLDKTVKLFGGALYRFGVANNQDIFQENNNYTIL